MPTKFWIPFNIKLQISTFLGLHISNIFPSNFDIMVTGGSSEIHYQIETTQLKHFKSQELTYKKGEF